MDLWLRHPQPEHEGALPPRLVAGHPLRRVWAGQQALWQGLTQWRAHGEEPGPAPCWPRCSARAGLCRCFTTGWSWRAGSACTGADDGARLVRFSQRLAATRAGGQAETGAMAAGSLSPDAGRVSLSAVQRQGVDHPCWKCRSNPVFKRQMPRPYQQHGAGGLV